MCQTNVEAVATMEDGPQKVDLQATILYHRAQMLESIGKSEKALSFYHEVPKMRGGERPVKYPDLYRTEMNLARCFSSANDYHRALLMLDKTYSDWLDYQ